MEVNAWCVIEYICPKKKKCRLDRWGTALNDKAEVLVSEEYLISFVLWKPATTKYKYCWHFHLVNFRAYSPIFVTEPRSSEENLSNCCADNFRLYMNSTHQIILLLLFSPKVKIAVFSFLKKCVERNKKCKEKEYHLYCIPSHSTWKWTLWVSWCWYIQNFALFAFLLYYINP